MCHHLQCWPNHCSAALQVVIETVDSFQGKQMDVVIMSCVRASEPGLQSGIGFVSDIRRMNVAITRAKRALWILGSAATLKVSRPLASYPRWSAQYHSKLRCSSALGCHAVKSPQCVLCFASGKKGAVRLVL